MRRVAPLLGLLIALLLTSLPARAQFGWWLGSSSDAQPAAPATAWWMGEEAAPQRPMLAQAGAWWLGNAGGANLPSSPPVSMGQTVAWWLGSGEATPAAPADTTLPWWMGSSARADDGDASAAEGQGAINYDTWEEIARAAEAALETPEVSNLALEQLRAEIARWRERFLTAQSANAARIATIRDQISALGPAPGEGEVEAPEIATRRAALNEQLALLQAPGIAAEESYRRADGIIREIDSILRERQTSELLELGPSPLVPLNWPPAFSALAEFADTVANEIADAWQSETSRAQARESLPATLALIAIGSALLLRGRTFSEDLAHRFLSGSGRRAKRVILALLISLGQVILPFVGLALLVAAAISTGFIGERGALVVVAVPTVGFVILAARWLGNQVFAKAEEAALLKGLAPERRAEGRLYATLLGLLLGLTGMIAIVAPHEGDTLVARVVLSFPVFVLGGLILFRLGQILVGVARAGRVEGGEPGTREQLLLLAGRAAMALGIAGPLLGAVGYYTLARFLIFPAVLSLALVAFLALLQRVASDLYALATRRGDDEEEALVPVLIGFALAIGALPVLALIWGARTSDLTELWSRAREGFTFGQTRIAPTDFITFAAVFAIGYLLTRLVQGALRNSVLPKTNIDPGGQTAIVSGMGYLGVFLAGIFAVTTAGIDLSGLAIVAGALSVGIGFGLQNIVSNFISGIILLVERPISEGDWIDVNGQQGYVRDISVRSTRIETFDRTDVIVPNSDLISGIVTNYTRGKLTGRIIVKVGVAYGTDTRKVETVLREIAEAHPLVTLNPPPVIAFMGFGADSLDFEIRAILRNINFALSTRSDMNHEIARRFTEEGIEIPFAQRDIWLRNPEALPGATPAPKAKAPAKGKARKPVTDEIDPGLRDPISGDPEGLDEA
jgi:potassium-dependent mechanosensitive channel